jgi:hypothetical protein
MARSPGDQVEQCVALAGLVSNVVPPRAPAGLDIHVVLENLATHNPQAVKAWLLNHSRFHRHFTRPAQGGSTSSSGSCVRTRHQIGEMLGYERIILRSTYCMMPPLR